MVFNQFNFEDAPSVEEGGVASAAGGGSAHTAAVGPAAGARLFQQWVTLTASMWPADNGTDTDVGRDLRPLGPTGPEGPPGAAARSVRLPILAAALCGAALVVCLLLVAFVYRCCIMPRRHKHYYMRKSPPDTITPPGGQAAAYPNHSAVFADGKPGHWLYSSRLVAPGPVDPHAAAESTGHHWFYNNRIVGAEMQCAQCPPALVPAGAVPRSTSNPGQPSASLHEQMSSCNTQRRQRPISQPIRYGPCDLGFNGESQKCPMPHISEFSPQNIQYASSSILDEVGTNEDEVETSTSSNLKTRSLPAWVRSKPRPLSTEDDLAELYAKVNFSKKRKNRMRNDEAAIIALSKSRSQFLHKDTDSLVDNEAVIVYDERTAL